MKSMSGKELAKVLERHGWKLLRIHGSHHIYGKAESVVRLSVKECCLRARRSTHRVGIAIPRRVASFIALIRELGHFPGFLTLIILFKLT